MLKALGAAVAVVLIAALGLAGFASTRPDTFAISRSLTIKAPPEKIYPLINDLSAFNRWNPFALEDPNAKMSYSGPAAGKGAGYAWHGNSNAGKGTVEITDSTPASRVSMRLDMVEPLEAHNRIEFTLDAKNGGTQVTWAMSGGQPLIVKIFGLFVDCDRMVGGQFEKGLQSLKSLAEQ